MKDLHPTTTVNTNATRRETAVLPSTPNQDQLACLFNEGWDHLLHHRWQEAEQTFAQIEATCKQYAQDGLCAATLRKKARHERKAAAALAAGKLEKALKAFKKADSFAQMPALQDQFTRQEMEDKAARALAVASYQEAAAFYDCLLNSNNVPEKTAEWQSKKEKCCEEALLPYFHIGVQAMETQQWRTAYSAFAQVLKINPTFRKDGRSAAMLAESVRKEVVLLADHQLRHGQVKAALAAYRQVGHTARIENVDEFLRLRQHEEELAQQLEAEGKWQEAAAKYKYLRTLYYDENGRSRWQEAANRCLEENKLVTLFTQGTAAFNDGQWLEAIRLFSQIIHLRPDYEQNGQSARKLYRVARWRSVITRLTSNQADNPPPQINTGKLS